MFNFLIMMLMMFFTSMIIIYFSSKISFKSNNMMEKMTPYECGFSYIKKSRNPFSLQFFLISIIFVIFDMELILLTPILFSNYFMFYNNFMPLFFFIYITFLFYFEWKLNSIEWHK